MRSHQRLLPGISAQQTSIPRRMQLAAGIAQSSAATISESVPGSPANVAGLLTGDMIVALDGQPVTGAELEKFRERAREDTEE